LACVVCCEKYHNKEHTSGSGEVTQQFDQDRKRTQGMASKSSTNFTLDWLQERSPVVQKKSPATGEMVTIRDVHGRLEKGDAARKGRGWTVH
jgi:hypothetical protein